MGNPVDSYLQQYKPQPDTTTAPADPVDDYLKSYSGHLAVGQPVPTQPQPDEGHPILSGIGQALKEAGQGTMEFMAEAGRPLAPPESFQKLMGQKPDTAQHPSGTELATQAVLAPFEMIAAGGKEALSAESTTQQKAHGSATAVLGALGLLGEAHGVKKFGKALRGEPKPTVQAPTPTAVSTSATPSVASSTATTELSKAKTPEERQAIVEQMQKQGEAVAASQQALKIQMIRAVQTWNTLSTEQRQAVVPGLAMADYTKGWKELGREAKTSVMKSLGMSGTLMDTSPSVLSGPAAQGEGAPPAPQAIPEEGSTGIKNGLASTSQIVQQINSEPIDLSKYTDEELFSELQKVTKPASLSPTGYTEHTAGPIEASDNPIAKAHAEAYENAIRVEMAKRAPYKPTVPPLTPEEQAVPTGEPPGGIAARAMGKTPEEVLAAIDPNSQAPGRATTPEQRVSVESITQETIPPQIKALSDEALRGAIEVYRDRATKATDPADVADNTQLADMLQREWDQRTTIGPDKRVTTANGDAGTVESVQGQRVVVKMDDGDLVNFSAGELNREVPRPGDAGTGATEPPNAPVVESPGSQAPEVPQEPSAAGAPLQGEPPIEPSPQDQLTLMREGVEPLDVNKLQSTEDQIAADKLIEETKPKRTLDELDQAIDDADNVLEAGDITAQDHAKLLGQIAEEKRGLKATTPLQPIAEPPAKFKMPDTVGKDLNKFSAEQLNMAKKSIGALLRSLDISQLPEANVLRREIDRILDYEAQIRKAAEGGAGPALATKRIDVEGRPSFEQYFAKKIVSNASFRVPFNMIKWLRQQYQGWVRPSHALNVADRLYEGATHTQLQTHHMAGRLMEMMDGSVTIAEAQLLGDGAFVPDGRGGTVKTGAKSFADILTNTAKGEVERFDWLWMARRALDLKALKNKDIGIDLGHAQELVVNSSQELHTAVDEARAFHSSMSLYAQMAELISSERRAAFEQETAYGPIQRMYGPQELVSKLSKTINTTGRPVEQIMASDEFKRLKGSDLLIRSPSEATIDVVHRIVRAAKINEIARELVAKAKDQPDLYKGMIDKFGHREHLQIVRDLTARAQAVKALFKESGIDISGDHANIFANLLSDDAMELKGGKLLVWEGGKIEAWKVDELIANSMKSLTPGQQATWVKMMGAPARIARVGIVLDPAFMLGQILNDQFQGWFNTRYGFTPVLDTFKGWWNIVHNTDSFKEAMRVGGIEKSSLRGRTTIGDVLAGPGLAPGELAFNQIKTGHPFKALRSILNPIREATRMGEYLKARGHGATPVEAAWAARDLLGNYSLQGTFATVRALNHMSLFLGPAIAVTDKTFRTIRERPVQWFSRAITLAGISSLLYLANQDDDEINNLRQTSGGQRWWFIRDPVGKEILKIRKPYFEGAVFASGWEAVLDEWKGTNPDAFKLWAQAVRQELALNMLPVMGAVPFQLWANKDFYTGAPIIPESQKGLDPQFQTGYYSGSAERIVGRATGIPPAILSYVTRGTTGYLGESGVKAVSAAMDWANTGELPPIEDLPLTQRVFAKYPTYNVKPVRDFYAMAADVDRAAKTINYAANHSPDDLEAVLSAHEPEIPLIELFNDSRQQMADLRSAIQSVDDLKDLGPQSKKEYTDEFLRSIIEIAGSTVQVARGMREGQ